MANKVPSARRLRRHRRIQVFLSVLATTIQKQAEILRDKTSRGVPCDSSWSKIAAKLHQVSSTLIDCTKIALKSQQVYTCDFEVATSARQKLH